MASKWSAAPQIGPDRRLWRWLVLIVGALTVLVGALPASAHPFDATLVKVSVDAGDVRLDVQIPLSVFDKAQATKLSESPSASIAAQKSALSGVFTKSVEIDGAIGTRWPLRVISIDATDLGGVQQLHAVLAATPGNGESPSSFVLTYRVVTEQIPGHDVYLASGRGSGFAPASAEVLGTINARHPTLAITLSSAGSPGSSASGAKANGVGLRAMIGRGLHHFRSGTDHILFITLLAASTAFTEKTTRGRIVALVVRSTAFTLGHAVSLTLAATGTLRPPERLVEVAIATTVLLTAIHLARPRIGHRAEAWVALLFGLVHGFGFSGTLANLGLHGRALIVPTFGFNVGLEFGQLAADLVLILPLWWLASRRWSRVGIAIPAIVIAGSWIIQRTWDTTNPIDPLVNVLVASPERLAAILALVAAAVALYGVARRPRPIA